MERKSKRKFNMEGYSPFTSNELTEEEKRRLFAEFQEQEEREKEEMKRRLKLHKPRGEAY